WRAPVRSAAEATARPPAASGGRTRTARAATTPAVAPTPAPTSGNRTEPRLMSAACSWSRRPTGTRVRKATAAIAALAAGIGHPRGGEGRHLGDDRQRALDHGQCEGGAAALAEAQAEIEQRL